MNIENNDNLEFLFNCSLSTDDKAAEFSSKILASLFYPSNAKKRDDLACSIFAHRASENDIVSEKQLNIIQDMGGYSAIARADSLYELWDDWENMFPNWTAVAQCSQNIACMHTFHQQELRGGASISKAIDLVIEASTSQLNKEMKGLPSNSKYIREAWSKFRPVAHFCIAFYVISVEFGLDVYNISHENESEESQIDDNYNLITLVKKLGFDEWNKERKYAQKSTIADLAIYIEMRFEDFLGIAKGYQDFFLNFVPKRSLRPILLKTEIIALPENIKGFDVYNGIGLEPLSNDQLDFLSKRFAPQRI